jgi:hypothetical protein
VNLEIVCAPATPAWPAEFMLHGRLPRTRYDSIPALSNSLMKEWLKNESTPSKFAWWLKNRWDQPPSSAMAMGLALDHMLLEPTTFPDRFAILPEKGPRGGDGPKTATAAHRAEHPGKVVLSHAQWIAAAEMAKALACSKATKEGALFQHCQKAVAVAELFGVAWKGEFDLWDEGRTTAIVDVKSARDISPAGFAKQAAELGYYYQATVYLLLARALGFDKRVFTFMCVLNEEPWTVKAYRFAPFENDEHGDAFHGIQARLGNAVRSLSAAIINGFKDDPRWENLTLPGWFVGSLRQEARLLE